MRGLRTTKNHSDYWANRQIDWKKEYLATWNHPHRHYIINYLKSFDWYSLMELGVGAGANIMAIITYIKKEMQLGGIDISPSAIQSIKETFAGGVWRVGSGEKMLMSDKSLDVIITDMCLIYVGPTKIRKYIKEMRRVARGRVVLCEFHSKSWLQRLLLRIKTGYNAYDYTKLLAAEGFYDIKTYKFPKEAYPGAKDMRYRYLIVGVAPKRTNN